ncbi:MAG: ribosome biogenesis GTPase Der [Spartobacteria bacterium]
MNVAIVGRPNVGKSALFNRLAGRTIAIVHDQPGITRDRISAPCTRGRRPFTLWDTGGIAGAGESELTKDVRRVVEEAIHDSDVLLFVVDAKSGLSPLDQELAQLLRRSRKPLILVVNKIDDDKHEDRAVEFDSLGFKHSVCISAAHGRGTPGLLEDIVDLLPATESEATEPEKEKPIALAIIGRPNVGKSSLINSILQSKRAIVSELAGTTRDAVDILYERGEERFTFIDTAGIRRRGAHSTSVEVFSVMRAERSIRRADLCVLIVDLTSGVTSQDKRIAGLIQKSRKPCIVVLNKWDLVKPKRAAKQKIQELVEETQGRLFFLDYAPILIGSAKTGENVDRLFRLIEQVRGAARKRIGTGVLNRRLRAAFAANPSPMVANKRLKLFYAAQASGETQDRHLQPPQFVLFVNDLRLLSETYGRYLEAQIREIEPYPGLPVLIALRPRVEQVAQASRLRPNKSQARGLRHSSG